MNISTMIRRIETSDLIYKGAPALGGLAGLGAGAAAVTASDSRGAVSVSALGAGAMTSMIGIGLAGELASSFNGFSARPISLGKVSGALALAGVGAGAALAGVGGIFAGGIQALTGAHE